ncbi:NAD(P)/FAD-dependent oxidoreductase [Streptomyces capparidis]
MPARAHVVVLGGSLAGLLAAAVLADHADVTVVEQDELPEGPHPRRGVPQARHSHLLWSAGARAIEALLPGATHRWLQAGARRVGVPDGLVALSPQGWFRRQSEMQHMILAGRDLMDWPIRTAVLARPGITVRHARAEALDGTARRITGVRVSDPRGRTEALKADLVVDATGRGSRTRRWLTELGLPTVRTETVDSGLVYATRIFRAPPGTDNMPMVNVQADPHLPRPARTAILVPIEDHRWMVTVSGTHGGQPTADPDNFLPFARSARHPIVADLLAGAEPLTPVHLTRGTANRRHHYERLPHWPAGLLVTGDALATYNPVYGHGMVVAAHSAAALKAHLTRHGLHPGHARALQRALARTVEQPWAMATAQDMLYPGATGKRPTPADRLLQRYLDRLTLTATSRPAATRALLDLYTLSTGFRRLIAPHVIAAALRGPLAPPPPDPPLTAEERRFHHPGHRG